MEPQTGQVKEMSTFKSDMDISDVLISAAERSTTPMMIVKSSASAFEDSVILWANTAVSDLLLTAKNFLEGASVHSFLHPHTESVMIKRERIHKELITLRSADGSPHQVEFTSIPTSIADTFFLSFTFPQHSNATMTVDGDHGLLLMLERSPIPTMLSEISLRLGYVNDALCSLLGATAEDLLGVGWLAYVSDDMPAIAAAIQEVLEGNDNDLEISLNSASGDKKTIILRLTALIQKGQPSSFIGTMEDVTAQREFERALHHQARHDPLTSLPNRQMLNDELPTRIADISGLACYFIDLDHFKEVNDTLGHQAGDEMIVEIAQRLSASTRSTDLVARWGGDEFVILCNDIHDDATALITGQRILSVVSQPMVIKDKNIFPTISVGVVRVTEQTTGEEVLRDADAAMYQAKQGGRNRVEIFDHELRQSNGDDWDLCNDFRAALANEEIFVEYQPVLCLEEGKTVQVEALARWNHPTLGPISPLRFVTLAEKNNMSEEFSTYIIRHTFEQMRTWRSEGVAPERVSINISPSQLKDISLVDYFATMIDQYGVPGSCINVEITETALMVNTQMAHNVLSQLKDMDITISIDDFGTGHSSLSLLYGLPINCIKIDKFFIDQLENGEEVIVNAIIGLAKGLKLRTVAEGVETVEVANKLRAMGCDMAQGWLFARSMSGKNLTTWKESRVTS